ncbi:MAG: diguanylate cyclase [Desulfovermiculus sp.]
MPESTTSTLSPVKDSSTKPWFIASIGITLFLAGLLVWYLIYAFSFVHSFKSEELAVERSSWKLLLYDETMSMATRVSTLSGNLKWQGTYAKNQPKLDQLLTEIPETISSPKIRDMVATLRRDRANLKEMENRAFELVSRGDKEEAADLLAGWPYIKSRMQFENTTRELVDLVQERIEDKTSLQKTLSVALLGGIAACLAALAFFWTRTVVLWRGQLRNKAAAEKALQQREQEFSSLVANLPGIAFHCRYDQDWTMLFMSPETINITGYPASDFINNTVRTYTSVMHTEDEAFVNQQVSEAVEADRHWEIEYRIIHKSGAVRWVWERGVAVADEEGKGLYLNGFINDITERRDMEERLKDLSIADSLTGVYNRNFFEEEMRRLSDGRNLPMGLIVCDINGLKLINDTKGHEEGDDLLRSCAEILCASFRKSDIIARIGGDEFVVLLSECSLKEVREGCARIREGIADYQERQPEKGLSVSLGYSVMDTSPVDVDLMFKRADDAMYKEKLQQSHSSRSETVQALIKTMEARDYITEGHAGRMHS